MIPAFPRTPDEFLARGEQFWSEVRQVKQQAPPLCELGWYPYDSLSTFPVIAELLGLRYEEIASACQTYPAIDIGCGDGDLAVFLSRLGMTVDALDYSANNYNRLSGVRTLSKLLNAPLNIHDLNLDTFMTFPRRGYGIAFFLGILYHLKNPYGVLEELAYHTRWCLLSTRVAKVTPSNTRFDREPLVYLPDGREIENDATNYWIFSSFALLRLLQRTRWAISGFRSVGCHGDSNPVARDADERMFVLAQSRVFYPALSVRPLSGWYAPEEDRWQWTAKRFGLGVVLPLEVHITKLILDVVIPEPVAACGPVTLSCTFNGQVVGQQSYTEAGQAEFRGELPVSALHEPVLQLDFDVESAYLPPPGDTRDLGLCVPLLDNPQKEVSRIPIRVE